MEIKPYKKVTILLSLLVALLGFIFMVAWLGQIHQILQFHPDYVPMQFNTALSFVLIGFGLTATMLKRYWLGKLFAATTALISIMTLFEYLSGVSLGIDNLVIQAESFLMTTHPGRMSPNSALCFILASSYIYIGNLKWHGNEKHIIMAGISTFILVINLIAIWGYVGHIKEAYAWGAVKEMALYSSAGFFIWSMPALIFEILILMKTEYRASIARSSIVLILALTLIISVWNENISLLKNSMNAFMQSEADKIFNEIKLNYGETLSSVDLVRHEIETEKLSGLKSWKNVLVHDYVGKKNLVSVEKSDVPIEKLTISSFFKLNNNDYGYAVSVPIEIDGVYQGTMIVNFDFQTVLEQAYQNASRFFNLRIKVKDEIIFQETAAPEYGLDEDVYSKTYKLDETAITFYLVPNYNAIAFYQSWPAISELLIGLLASILLSAMFMFYDTIRFLGYRNNLILETVGEGICGIDADGRVTFTNKSAEQLLGYSNQELRGAVFHDMIHLNNDGDLSCKLSECPSYKAILSGEVQKVGQDKFRRKDGKVFDVAYESRPILLNSAKAIGAVVSFSDITEQKNKERELAKKQLALKLANDELETFNFAASHGLRTPLRHIMGFSALVEEQAVKLDEKIRHYVDNIHKSAEEIDFILDELLNYSRSSSVELNPSEINLKKIADESVNHFSEEISRGNIHVSVDDLSIAYCDRNLIREVFDILISNAIKFTSKKQNPEIHISGETNDNKVTVRVQDNGVGFDQKFVNKVFAAFQRVHPKDEYPGVGVELPLALRIIQRHGGEMGAEGNLNKGAVFYFTLPRFKEAAEETIIEDAKNE